MEIAVLVSTVLEAVLFLTAAVMKLTGHPKSLATRDRLEMSAANWRGIGVLELFGVAGALLGLSYRPLGIAALTGLTLLSFGALGFHLRERDPLSELGPPVLAVVFSITALALQIATA